MTELKDHHTSSDLHSRASLHAQVRCLHQLIEEQVERTPDAVALVWEGEQVSYSEMNRRANQLARRLQAVGGSTSFPL